VGSETSEESEEDTMEEEDRRKGEGESEIRGFPYWYPFSSAIEST